MDVPDLVRQAVGDEEIRAGVTLGDEDAVVFTPTRALVYRGEGLLSDEDVAAYGFDFERLAVSEGRRKTKFTMTYVDGERSFGVPGKRTDDVLAQLVEGRLRVAEAIGATESVTGVFRFSEMTLVVTDARLLKHVGEYTWDADFEAFQYDDLTRLSFEEGSVATQVVLAVGNRSERIKAPNAEAGIVRKTLQQAVFAHYDVGSLDELNRLIAVEPDDDGPSDVTGGLGLDSGIDPLVSDDPAEESDVETEERSPGSLTGSAGAGTADAGSTDANSTPSSGAASGHSGAQGAAAGRSTSQQAGSSSSTAGDRSSAADGNPPSTGDQQSSVTGSSGQGTDRAPDADAASGNADATPGDADVASTVADASENAAVSEQLADLTRAVERQNELLHRQQRTVQKLIEELRQGR